MEKELTLDEQTLLTMFRGLDHAGQKELLRHASEQHRLEEAVATCAPPSGRCRLERGEERPETVSEPIFTE